MKKTKAITDRLISELEKAPIIEIACKKIGITRQTFYRWVEKDFELKSRVDDAIQRGSELINDMAESTLIQNIKDNELTAVIFWLKNRHEKFRTKVQLSGKIKNEIELSDEEKEELKESLNNL